MNQALKRKRPEWRDKTHKVILLQDNARPYVAKPVKTYLENIKWDVLPHMPYSPDLAPSDYCLFRSIQHVRSEQHFNSYEEVKNWMDEWLASKNERWQRRVGSLGLAYSLGQSSLFKKYERKNLEFFIWSWKTDFGKLCPSLIEKVGFLFFKKKYLIFKRQK